MQGGQAFNSNQQRLHPLAVDHAVEVPTARAAALDETSVYEAGEVLGHQTLDGAGVIDALLNAPLALEE